MGLMDKLRGELIDVIEWIEDDNDTIAIRFDRYGNEIKNGAQLTVREGQMAVFVNEGELADVFTPGMYELNTENLPVLSTLKGWKYGFKSPFKAEVYFITTRSIPGFGWGTPGPFRMRDPEFGILEMTARGHFAFHVVDGAKFLKNVIGTDGNFTKAEIKDRLRKKFVTEAISGIAESGKTFYEMAGHMDDLSEILKTRTEKTFTDLYGIVLDDTSIQSIDLTERSAQKVESRDELMFMETGKINTYERVARADALKMMAQNEGTAGGMAAGGMGMGMGMAMAGQMGNQMGMQNTPPPPPIPAYMVYANGQQSGPFQVPQLSQLISSGQIPPNALVWKQGMAQWTPISSIPELSGPMAPPPVPGS
jgi:membrane protease subunit (stomatin/prohibitin family)